MSFFGIGNLELLLIVVIALLVVGPKRLVEGIRTARGAMTEMRRQRDDLTEMVRQAIDYEDLKDELENEGLSGEIRDLRLEITNEVSGELPSLAKLGPPERSTPRSGGIVRGPDRVPTPAEQPPEDGSPESTGQDQ